jgi:precorrin isomerase
VLSNLGYSTDSAIDQISLSNLRSFLRDDRLNAPHEELVKEIIFTWINFDRENRLTFLPQLLQLLRVGFLNPSFIDKVYKNIL